MLIASVSVPQQNEAVVLLEISVESVAYREGEKLCHGNVRVELQMWYQKSVLLKLLSLLIY